MSDNTEHSLAGQTLRWKFDGGPTGGKVYEHVFSPDGTVTYREVENDESADKQPDAADAPKGAAKKAPPKYASFAVGPDRHLMSYLSDNGYTLTVYVDVPEQRVHGFASNDKEWFPLAGVMVS